MSAGANGDTHMSTGSLAYVFGNALRSVARKPSFSLVCVLVLGVGVGANTAMFTPLNAILLKPVDAVSPDQLRSLSWSSPRRAFAGRVFSQSSWDERIAAGETIEYFSYAVYERLKDESSAFSELACWYEGNVGVITAGGHSNVRLVSGNYFGTLGVEALLGRTITEADEQAENHVAIISHRVWRRHFG